MDLKKLFSEYPQCAEDAAKLRAYLKDLYPEEKARTAIVVAILECGIAQEIKALKGTKIDSIAMSRYCDKLENEYGYSKKIIKEGLILWKEACVSLSKSVSKSEYVNIPRDIHKTDPLATVVNGAMCPRCHVVSKTAACGLCGLHLDSFYFQEGMQYWERHSQRNGNKSDIENAVTNVTISSSLDYPPALNMLGFFYQHGLGVENNLEKAMEYYQKGAEFGDSLAMYNLALCYEDYIDDMNQAIYWFTCAANLGNVDAMYNLGCFYADGEKGVFIDKNQAASWFAKAASKGDPDAQGRLGVCYLTGSGVPQNISRGVDLVKKGVEGGSELAQEYLETCIKLGICRETTR